MILVADGGSTKIDWLLTDGEKVVNKFKSTGVNPYYYKAEKIVEIFEKEIPKDVRQQKIEKIYFYGAGCSSEERNARVKTAIEKIYNAGEVYVEHDLLGAARALCFDKPGLVAILGTGSNACYYDGKDIAGQSGGIGFILGDEGSGADFGKKLVQALFYKDLPDDIKPKLYKFTGDDDAEIIDKIYRKEFPNRYLASFAPFVEENKSHPFIKELIYSSLKDFFRLHIKRLDRGRGIPCNSVGSIAFYHQDTVKTVLEELELVQGIIVQKPVERLLEYHRKFNV